MNYHCDINNEFNINNDAFHIHCNKTHLEHNSVFMFYKNKNISDLIVISVYSYTNHVIL